MRFFVRTMLIVVMVGLFSGCASIVSTSTWPLTVDSTPKGAKVEITDVRGFNVYTGKTPATVLLKSGAGFFMKQSYQVRLSLDGYEDRIFPVDCTLNGWYIGNLVFGGVIGFLIVDPMTGAMYRLEREYISEPLIKITADAGRSLKIIDINDLSETMKEHLVSIE